MKKLEGRVAIVTGAAGGIGVATVKRLAADGARLVVADINFAGAETTAGEINATGGEAIAVLVDLSDEDSIIALYQRVASHYGRLDILNNNAADQRPEQMAGDRLIGNMPAAIWDRAFAVNVRGTMQMIKHGLPLLMSSKTASIINISSGAGASGDLAPPAYGASKGAINSLTRYVATQYGKRGVRCNAIAPGVIVTPGRLKVDIGLPSANLAWLERHNLLPYNGAVDDIAGAVAFLASDDSRFITAQIISVDGGLLDHTPYFAETYESFWAVEPSAL
jgi:NAD(P)-dependent dehydrogenase (short-subunit alcohol dehydrogenase family)